MGYEPHSGLGVGGPTKINPSPFLEQLNPAEVPALGFDEACLGAELGSALQADKAGSGGHWPGSGDLQALIF